MKYTAIAICAAILAGVIGCASVPKEDRVATALLLVDTGVATLEAVVIEFRDADDPSEDLARFIRLYNVLRPSIVAAMELISSSGGDMEQQQQFEAVADRFRAVSEIYTVHEGDLDLAAGILLNEPAVTLEPLED